MHGTVAAPSRTTPGPGACVPAAALPSDSTHTLPPPPHACTHVTLHHASSKGAAHLQAGDQLSAGQVEGPVPGTPFPGCPDPAEPGPHVAEAQDLRTLPLFVHGSPVISRARSQQAYPHRGCVTDLRPKPPNRGGPAFGPVGVGSISVDAS